METLYWYPSDLPNIHSLDTNMPLDHLISDVDATVAMFIKYLANITILADNSPRAASYNSQGGIVKQLKNKTTHSARRHKLGERIIYNPKLNDLIYKPYTCDKVGSVKVELYVINHATTETYDIQTKQLINEDKVKESCFGFLFPTLLGKQVPLKLLEHVNNDNIGIDVQYIEVQHISSALITKEKFQKIVEFNQKLFDLFKFDKAELNDKNLFSSETCTKYLILPIKKGEIVNFLFNSEF
jgi:hypothetical protein